MSEKSAIHTAADEIFAATGKAPTLVAIRKALGGGSFSTISEGMKSWKSQAAAASAPLREAAPAAITDRVGELAADIWQVAIGIAGSRLASEHEALDVARQALERTQAEAVELADQLAAELDAMRGQMEEMEEQAAKSQAALVEAQKRVEEAQTRADSLARVLESEREMTREAWAKAERALIDAARLEGRLSALQNPQPPLPLANGQA